MTAKAAETSSANTGIEPASTKAEPANTKPEPANTEGWVYRCSCGYEVDVIARIGGHFRQYRDDKVNHKNLGFGPPRKAAVKAAEPAAEVAAEVAVLAEDAKSKVKGKKSAGEKTGKLTTNFEEASVIVVSPVVLFLLYEYQSCWNRTNKYGTGVNKYGGKTNSFRTEFNSYNRGCLEMLLRPGVREGGGNRRSHCAEE
jgi:hypothetical protein